MLKPTNNCACKEDYAWNPSIYVCEFGTDSHIDKYLENCTFMKIFVDDSVNTCHEFVYMQDNVPNNSIYRKQHIKRVIVFFILF